MLSLSLSARAECLSDVNCIFLKMLQTQNIMPFVSSYRCHGPDIPPLPDRRFDVDFVAPEARRAAMHGAVRAFIELVEAQEDAHCCMDTMAFSDEYTGAVFDDGDVDERIVRRLKSKTMENK